MSNQRIRYATGACCYGRLLVADLVGRFPEAAVHHDAEAMATMLADTIRFVEAPDGTLDVPLDIGGTPFQRRVWQVLQSIPPGSTASYAEIAARVGAPRSARAVARACASNPLAVAVPCHRVVRADGGLSGYRWGIYRKRAMLRREAGR
jgi:O-6-methylguanine DNA methyltransferase